MDTLLQHIEALVFAAEQPISLTEIQQCLQDTFETDFEPEAIEKAVANLMERYQDEQFAIEVIAIADGFQFMSKGAYHSSIGTYLRQTMRKRLSLAALETLAIIAYKQPTTKSELEKIRGVSCDYSIQKLLEKELVSIVGRSEGPGRPLLYGTSEKFMDYFGLKSLRDLPQPRDFKQPEYVIGEQAPIEEITFEEE